MHLRYVNAVDGPESVCGTLTTNLPKKLNIRAITRNECINIMKLYMYIYIFHIFFDLVLIAKRRNWSIYHTDHRENSAEMVKYLHLNVVTRPGFLIFTRKRN